jgi:beta-xylosidase
MATMQHGCKPDKIRVVGRPHGGALLAAAALCDATTVDAPGEMLPLPDPAPTIGPTHHRQGISNPVIDEDFPDPDTLRVGDLFYAYATNVGGVHVPVARSVDLVDWQRLPDALPVLPAWASPGYTWAPEVTVGGDGYVLYCTARHADSGLQCIGVATSDDPAGPFQPLAGGPLVCQVALGGSIDPASFVDVDGARYLLWKNDGNARGLATWIYLQRTSDDGLRLEGEAIPLLTADQPWEASLVEAPTLWRQDGRYYLFYSANSYAAPDYAIGYAMADAVAGPYRKAAQPLLVTPAEGGLVLGPGGQDVVVDKDGATWLLHHAWDNGQSYRSLHLANLAWVDGRPMLRRPEREPAR